MTDQDREENFLSRDLLTTFIIGSCSKKSVHHFIGAATTCKRFRFGLECETHTENITHCFFKRIIAFEMRVGIDIRMHFHIDIVPGK